MWKIFSIGMLLAGVALTGTAVAPPGKKAIAHSWGNLWATPQSLEKALPKWEKTPFDGITMTAQLQEAGKEPRQALLFMSEEPYSWDALTETLRIWKLASSNLKHNFVITMWEPKERLRWDDDAAWDKAAHNIGILARLARESGCKGILIDPEDYPKSAQYHVAPDEEFGTVSRLARRRGAEMMESMIREYPDLTILSFYLLSNHPGLWNYSADPRYTAEQTGNLWPSFFNGMLDALPPEALMIDGCEYGYALEFDVHGYFRLGNDIRQRAMTLVEPENQEKYRKQVQLGFGLFMDPYLKLIPPSKVPFKVPFNGSLFNRLAGNFNQAMQVADEYCWFYGERRHWVDWGWKGAEPKTWDEELPGVHQVIDFVKNPPAQAGKWLDKARRDGRKLQNLIANPDCTPQSQDLTTHAETDWQKAGLQGWWFWQYRDKTGHYGLASDTGYQDNYSAVANAIGKGCFLNSIAVTPGDWYVVESRCKGGRLPYMELRWQKKSDDGKIEWITSYMDILIPYGAQVDENGWRRAVGVAIVPPGAVRMVIHLWDNLGEGTDSTVWFDSLNVYRIPVNGNVAAQK